jgi:hypothetical protein
MIISPDPFLCLYKIFVFSPTASYISSFFLAHVGIGPHYTC